MDHDNRFWIEFHLDDIARALNFARLRTMSTMPLIDSISEDRELGNFPAISALKERNLSPGEQEYLGAQLLPVLTDEHRARLSVRARPRTDRLLLHLGLLLPVPIARKLAYEHALHRLVARRRCAVKLLQRIGARSDDLGLLRDLFDRFRDHGALIMLAKFSGGLAGYTCCALVGNADPNRDQDANYHEGVILERLARDGQLDFEHATTRHPAPLLRALGRLRDRDLAPHLSAIVQDAPIDLLPLAASVAGRMSAEAVAVVERRGEEFRRSIKPDVRSQVCKGQRPLL